jgi:ATP-dependent exoDNAse (exonuclease V) alpha subunit
VCSPEAVRQALAEHPTIGEDQTGMVRDLCRRGAGVGVVVGKAGTGKTFALGVARHAFILDGYRVMGAAPTGIATTSLEAEGFEEVATVDRLLVELDQTARPRQRPRRDAVAEQVLDARTVLVVDEAGMVGSRKLTRLLDHAQQAGAKVVLVGDDRQLGAIDAGGGFRGLRLRLGASVLTENRRQQAPRPNGGASAISRMTCLTKVDRLRNWSGAVQVDRLAHHGGAALSPAPTR